MSLHLLSAVAHLNGLAFDGDGTVAARLRMPLPYLLQARDELLAYDLIAHEPPSFVCPEPGLDIHKHRAYSRKQSAYDDGKGCLMIKKPAGVTDAELAVLKVLWARGPLTAKVIAEAIYPDGAESEFAAVHSFLQRLERKGLVTRDRSSFVHVFSTTATQADVLGQELETLVERLGSDSIAPLIMRLISQKRLSKKEAAEIRKLLDKYSK